MSPKPRPELALLLRRMHLHNGYDRWNDITVPFAKADWEPQVPEHVKRHLPGLKALKDMNVTTGRVHDGCTTLWLRKGSIVPTVGDVLAHMNPNGKASVNELTAYILLKGNVYGTYGSYVWPNELIHTLLCGIDWEKSTEPQNDTWSEFAGTFVDNEQESMTEVQLYCLCGHVDKWDNACHVGVPALGVAQLLKIAEGEMRDAL